MSPNWDVLRDKMVADQLKPRGITDSALLEVMSRVSRERFVPQEVRQYAYEDGPLAIGQGQTISQPFIVALTTQSILPIQGKKVLEIGTGSGYQAAVLSELGADVCSIERIEALSQQAAGALKQSGYTDIELLVGDGSLGWPERAPFDRIVVTAGAPALPKAYLEQLVEGGKILIPEGPVRAQKLVCYTKQGDYCLRKEIESVRFVPLIGKEGWDLSSL